MRKLWIWNYFYFRVNFELYQELNFWMLNSWNINILILLYYFESKVLLFLLNLFFYNSFFFFQSAWKYFIFLLIRAQYSNQNIKLISIVHVNIFFISVIIIKLLIRLTDENFFNLHITYAELLTFIRNSSFNSESIYFCLCCDHSFFSLHLIYNLVLSKCFWCWCSEQSSVFF